jgi:hypothetical protein
MLIPSLGTGRFELKTGLFETKQDEAANEAVFYGNKEEKRQDDQGGTLDSLIE